MADKKPEGFRIFKSKEEIQENKGKQIYAYFWKTFNFTGKSYTEVHEDHPYCKDPLGSMSK